MRHTDCCHHLCFQAELVLETARDVVNSTTSVTSDVGNFADMVEHVSAGKQENGHQGQGCPEVAALQNVRHIRPSHNTCSNNSKDDGYGDRPTRIVERSLDSRMRSVGQLTSEPGVNLLGSRGSEYCLLVSRPEGPWTKLLTRH